MTRLRNDTQIPRNLVSPLLFVLLVAASSPVHSQSSARSLTSSAIDPTIYRDGEVRRFASVHGNWRVVCDEVTRLKKRFCSLRTSIVTKDGVAVAELTVSTGQDGRPAALLRISAPLVSGGRVEIAAPTPVAKTSPQKLPKATPAAQGQVKPAASPPTLLKAVSCDTQICTFIWTLRAEQIKALNDGNDLNLLAIAGPDLPDLASFAPQKPRTLTLQIPSTGFKDAVAVSLRPFE
jgi:invasion protein IalB